MDIERRTDLCDKLRQSSRDVRFKSRQRQRNLCTLIARETVRLLHIVRCLEDLRRECEFGNSDRQRAEKTAFVGADGTGERVGIFA